MSVYAILNDLSATSSGNEKLAILKKNSSNVDLKKTLELALNPLVNFWIKKIPEIDKSSSGIGMKSLTWGLDQLDLLSARFLTGNRAIEHLKFVLSELSIEDAEVIERVIARDLRCGVSGKTVNKVWKGLIPEFPVMLCSKNTPKLLEKIAFPAIVQKKEDGARLIAIATKGEGVSYFSRNGKELDLHGAFDDVLMNILEKCDYSDSLMFDGEMLLRQNDNSVANRQTGNGLMTKAVRGKLTKEESKTLVYTLWDMVDWILWRKFGFGLEYGKRWSNLTTFWTYSGDYPNVQLVETWEVNTLDEVMNVFDQMLEAGNEGIILKSLDSPFESKRSKHQIKFKAEKSIELRVMGMLEGTGKYKGKMGSLLLESDDGKISVNVGTGFSDSDRDWFWHYFEEEVSGGIVEIIYNTPIQDKNRPDVYSLFLPVFKALRNDKDSTNLVEDIL